MTDHLLRECASLDRERILAELTKTRNRIAALQLTLRELEHSLRRIPTFDGVESADAAKHIQRKQDQ